MKLDAALYLKTLSPRIMSKAVQSFDRVTTIVVGACWAGAILMMVFAIYTVGLSVSAKRATEAALVSEPALPKILHQPIDGHYAQVLLERLQHRYPEITFAFGPGQTLLVTALDGSRFRQWLTALSYIDTISPEYHWSIQQLCVGKCGAELMHATLMGERISFVAPTVETKN
jgi:hypothetical protein